MAVFIKFSQNEWVKFYLYKMAESKMAEFKMAAIIKFNENEWVKIFLCKLADSKMVESNMAELKMAAIIKLGQNEWVKLICANDWKQIWQVWVSLRGNTKMAESKMAKFKMAESNMAELKMAAIIKLGQKEWVKLFVQMGGTNLGKCKGVWEEILRWLNPRWPNSSW